MCFKTTLKIGQVINNEMLMKEFNIANSGGMRRSKKNNLLVIISDHTKGIYDDKYYGNELHYTGMGLRGDQDINRQQNKTLAESRKNGINIHLFEVFEAKRYIYRGLVELKGNPYQEEQIDENGNKRKVWMFPLCLKEESTIDENIYNEYYRRKEKEIKKISRKELVEIVKERKNNKVLYRVVKTNTYIRDPYIAEFARIRANGVCQLCNKSAPFFTKDNRPYLEAHHVHWLSKGGLDIISNVVALCPNCHQRMHKLNDKKDIEKLKKVLESYNETIIY